MATNSPHRVLRQVALFVRNDTEKSLAVWTDYKVHGKSRSKIEVLKTARALFPSYKIGMGERLAAYNVSYDGIEHWLGSHGYQVLDRIEATVDRPIKFF